MSISNELINWYKKNARNLPWRKTKDAYSIWLSEIILQQTRVEQGLPYYNAFLKAYPSLAHFSKASEDEILKMWQGLGYYSRARNMRFTAQQIMNQYQGKFPEKHSEILALKGVGSYTAAAIASFAYNLPFAVLDGNVFRVLSRYYGVEIPINSTAGKKHFEQLAQEILDNKHADWHNQAIMEFGALVCKPKKALCTICVLKASCWAFARNKVDEFPKKDKKIKIKNRYLHYFLLEDEKKIFIEKRDNSDIWRGLYQLPFIETEKEEITWPHEKFRLWLGERNYTMLETNSVKHKLTHQNLNLNFYHIRVNSIKHIPFMAIDKKQWNNWAFPQPIHNYLIQKGNLW
ncbi:MAG: A/G-specific adenine glycosylase [Bacteroidetes bacterium 4572_77]|nr:MAG: A/G-specific adenine glycosylase [Bacteroidetes bacterium 4572_77]